MISEDNIRQLVTDFLADGPLFLVDVRVLPGNKITVELDGDKGVGIDDCVKVSRHIEGTYDRDEEDYELQVTSAGIGSPLKNERQYRKNIGQQVRVICNDGNTLEGELKSVGNELVIGLKASKKKALPARDEAVAWDNVKETKVKISFK